MDLNLRGLLRSLETILNTVNVRLVEEAIPHSSSRRTNSVVHTGSQDRMLAKLAQDVIGPLKSGLQSFNAVSEILLSVHEDVIPGGSQTFYDIRRQIQHMTQQMQSAENIAKRELVNLDRQTELLTAEQGRLARRREEEGLQMDNLWKQLDSNKSTLKNLKDALRVHRRNLESAEETLENMKKRRDDAEVKMDVALGLAFIPVVGLFVGVPLALAGDAEMKQSTKGINAAREEVNDCESEIRSYLQKVSEYENKIFDVKRKIGQTDDRIHHVDFDLRALPGKREAVAYLQAKMREAVYHLGVLSGVGSAAELHTRRQVLLEPVMRVMEEMTTALDRITGDQLLNTEGIMSLMGRMRSNQHQLRLRVDARHGANDYY